jgi:predicted lysophospholipase L1 biosynthesis ABC-type transport system permease subunit
MKANMYINYPARSLLRGGQRTALALFCVAVGVMAIVGLQLVGGMIKGALVGNARVINGGDVSVSVINPLAQSDLAYFDQLKAQGILTSYTAVYGDQNQLNKPNGGRAYVQIKAVDPALYPLTGQPALARTAGGDFRAVLSTPGSAVVSHDFFEAFGSQLGKKVTLTVGTDSHQLDVTIGGVLGAK